MARRIEVKPGSDDPFIDLDLRGDAFYTQFARAFVWYCAPGSRKETLRHVWCIVGGDPAAADSIPPDNIALAVGVATVASMRRAHGALGNVDDLRPRSIDTEFKEFLLAASLQTAVAKEETSFRWTSNRRTNTSLFPT